MVLTFAGPATATGEDVVELHCHGGRAVVVAIERALAAMPGLRRAEPGEFTRRALMNGRIDLAEAEGLADLLSAETERQRRVAMATAEGRVGQAVRGWLSRIAALSARVEAALDYADEDDVMLRGDDAAVMAGATALGEEIAGVLAAPPVERLRDGIRVVIAGPPNAGKSTLLNLLTERDVAIVTPIAGTTRDRLEVGVTRDGIPYLLSDTAGLTQTADAVERIGIERAHAAMDEADILVWLGDDPPPKPAIWVHARADLPARASVPAEFDLAVSQNDGGSIDGLWGLLGRHAELLIPASDAVAMNRRQRDLCGRAVAALCQHTGTDLLIAADNLRYARENLSELLGERATEVMLDALFRQFCIGK